MTTPSYPVSTIAKLFNLTERRVQQLAKEGVIPKPEKGKYDLVGCVRGYVAYLQERAFGKTMAVGDTHHERARLLKLQADKTELEVETIRGKLIPAEETEELWASLLATFRARMLAMPTRAAHLVSHLKEFYAIEHTLRDLVIDALTELARYDPNSRTTGADTGAETSQSPAETDHQPVGGSPPAAE